MLGHVPLVQGDFLAGAESAHVPSDEELPRAGEIRVVGFGAVRAAAGSCLVVVSANFMGTIVNPWSAPRILEILSPRPQSELRQRSTPTSLRASYFTAPTERSGHISGTQLRLELARTNLLQGLMSKAFAGPFRRRRG